MERISSVFRTVHWVLLCALLASTDAYYHTDGSKEAALINYVSENGTITSQPAAMGTFGDHPYGRELRCQIVYYTDVLFECDNDCEYGCQAPQGPRQGSKLPSEPFCLFLKMAKSGRCYYYMQAMNAEALGAAAVILMDDKGPLDVPTYPPIQGAVSAQANISIPVLSTLKSSLVDSLLAKAALAPMQENSYPAVTIDFKNVITQAEKVEVEFYGTERDLCEDRMGTYCDRKLNFIRMIAGWMVRLARQGSLTFRYRSLLTPCRYFLGTYCEEHCTNNGRYCVRQPPPGTNTTGAQVVKHMAFSECVSQLADISGEYSFWWDFKLLDDERCNMGDHTFTLECAEDIVRWLGGNQKLQGGVAAIYTCMGDFDIDAQNPLLEASLQDAQGNADRLEITFDPTYIINGVQYRGRWTRGAWFEAVCAGFESNEEPALCLDSEISFDECAPGEYGREMCMLREDTGHTHCTNTFRGFLCDCDPARFSSMSNPTKPNAEAVCLDKNECLTLSLEDECTCERCACHNTYGSYKCESKIPNICEEANGGCWSGIFKGKEYTACKDNLRQYKEKAAEGKIGKEEDGSYSHALLQHCECPRGFKGDGVDVCEPLCKSDPEFYLEGAGCVQERSSSIRTASIVGWTLACVLMFAVGLVAAGLILLRRRKQEAIKSAVLNQTLLGDNEFGPSDAIGAGRDVSEDDPGSNQPTAPPPQETEMGTISRV